LCIIGRIRNRCTGFVATYRDVYAANAYSAEREMSANACTRSTAGLTSNPCSGCSFRLIDRLMFRQRRVKPERRKSVGDRRRHASAVRRAVSGRVRPQLGLPGGRLRQHRSFPLHGLRRHRQNTHQDTRPVPERCGTCVLDSVGITYRVSRRRREMYIGHARLSVCLSVRGRMPTLLNGPGCNLGKW